MHIRSTHRQAHDVAGSGDPTAHRRAFRAVDPTATWRTLLLTILFFPAGIALYRVLGPLLPESLLSETIAAHIPVDAPAVSVWLSLCGARLPVLLLLAVAGLTRFSGGLTSLILAWRGLSDGMATALLVSAAFQTGNADTAISGDPVVTVSVGILGAYIAWTAVDIALRTIMAAHARRFSRITAHVYASPLSPDDRIPTEETCRLRYDILYFVAVTLAVFCIGLLSCALYAAALCLI